MWCTQCGSKISEIVKFCETCGAPVLTTPNSSVSIPNSKSPPELNSTNDRQTRPLESMKLILRNQKRLELPMFGNFMIGRHDGNDRVDLDLTEEDPNLVISRKHAQLRVADHNCFIKDLSSRNGTFVNGRKLNANVEVMLQHHDKINIGQSSIEFLKH